MNPQVKKPSIASMLMQLGRYVVNSGSTVSFQVKNRSFTYDTERRTFTEHLRGTCKSTSANEVYSTVQQYWSETV
jgi:hypothetical protein